MEMLSLTKTRSLWIFFWQVLVWNPLSENFQDTLAISIRLYHWHLLFSSLQVAASIHEIYIFYYLFPFFYLFIYFLFYNLWVSFQFIVIIIIMLMQLGRTQYTHPSIFFAPVALPAIEKVTQHPPSWSHHHRRHHHLSAPSGQGQDQIHMVWLEFF